MSTHEMGEVENGAAILALAKLQFDDRNDVETRVVSTSASRPERWLGYWDSASLLLIHNFEAVLVSRFGVVAHKCLAIIKGVLAVIHDQRWLLIMLED